MSSTFVDAIGFALFKNIFWSSSFEHDGSYLPFPKKVLLNREIFIVTLSTGPVIDWAFYKSVSQGELYSTRKTV